MGPRVMSRTRCRLAANRRRRTGVGVVLAAALLNLAGCGAPPTPVAEIVIGATLPLTGSDADTGLAAQRGYERALAEVRALGGLRLGPSATATPVRLDLRDDASETPKAEQLVEAMVRGDACLVLATPNAVRAAAQADVTERAQRLLIVNSSDAPGLPGSRMRWVVAVTGGGDTETHGYQTLRTALAAIAEAGTVDNAALRLRLTGSR
jgi:ABC-type branched-subunit amino acid transport system substrate-binding protein